MKIRNQILISCKQCLKISLCVVGIIVFCEMFFVSLLYFMLPSTDAAYGIGIVRFLLNPFILTVCAVCAVIISSPLILICSIYVFVQNCCPCLQSLNNPKK
jgi:hypothetical protein